jgi:uncharacterized membrane protein YbhN (UPF0104 family)
MALKVWILISVFIAMVAYVALYVIYRFFIKLKKHEIDDFDIIIFVLTIIVIVWFIKDTLNL